MRISGCGDISVSKILIADDSAFMRTVLKNILFKEGFEDLVEAKDGNEALEKFEKEKPDLILLDIIMPGLDGIGVLKALRFKAVKVIVISAVGQEKMMEEARTLGAKKFIIKPFEAKNVIDAVKGVLSGAVTS